MKLERIKKILQKVSKELADERRELSSLKVSMSQSFSQIENDLSDTEVKERARNLISLQKRLLGAFKAQKIIANKVKEQNHERNKPKVARYALNMHFWD